jgi:hypothetical protein
MSEAATDGNAYHRCTDCFTHCQIGNCLRQLENTVLRPHETLSIFR